MTSSKSSSEAGEGVEWKEPTPTLELNDPTLLPRASFINNATSPIRTSQDLKVYNPFNNAIVSRVTQASSTDISYAVECADTSQRKWRNSTLQQRSLLLQKWHDLIKEFRDDLARILTLENGKPLPEAHAEVDYSASFFLWNSQEALHYTSTSVVQTGMRQTQVSNEPIGTVLAITPWNFPMAMLARKIAPAIAAGCAVIAKPATETPLSALALAEIGRRAGAPAGLFNVLVTTQNEEVVDQVMKAECIRMVTFTGSTVVGRSIAAKAAERVLRTALELGGNAPFIVFDDADVKAAVDGLLMNKFRCSGQTCISANRVYVQDGIHDAFVASAEQAMKKLVIGNGLEDGVQIGPLISQDAVKKVEMHVNQALESGATRLLGGLPDGNLYPVTLLIDVTDDMECSKAETFGPVVPVLKFTEDSEVWERANQGEAGLAAYLYTSDLRRAMTGIRELKYGMVGVNSTSLSSPSTSFGGMRQSGIGREGGQLSLQEFSETKFSLLHFGA